jgi:hypothetical protein
MDIFKWLWLADICDSTKMSLAITLILCGIFITILAGIYIFEDRQYADPKKIDRIAKSIKICIIMLVVGLPIICILPSQQTIYISLGVDTISDLTNKTTDSALGQKAIRLLESKIDEELKDIQPAEKKEREQ